MLIEVLGKNIQEGKRRGNRDNIRKESTVTVKLYRTHECRRLKCIRN
jgi:hypothetical protein